MRVEGAALERVAAGAREWREAGRPLLLHHQDFGRLRRRRGHDGELWEGKHDSFVVGWVVSAHGRVAARGYDSHRLAALPQSEGPKPLSASLDAHIILILE